MAKKTYEMIFYAKHLPSGFYALFIGGDPKFYGAAYTSPDQIRTEVDKIVASVNRSSQYNVNTYSLTFNEESYKYLLENCTKDQVIINH